MTEHPVYRALIWGLLIVMLGTHVWFDLWIAPVAIRLADKAIMEQRFGNPTHTLPDQPIHREAFRMIQMLHLAWIALGVFVLRFALTALPILLIVFRASGKRLRESHLTGALILGCYLALLKVFLWGAVWYVADLFAYY